MKVVVAGSTGLAGSAISAAFSAQGHHVIGLNRSIVDLMDGAATQQFLINTKPSLVIHAPAIVGDPTKATKVLKWQAKSHWKEIAELMVDSNLAQNKN